MMIKKLFSRLLRDERGQSTTEYIVMLSLVVMIAMKFKSQIPQLLSGILGKTQTNLQDIENIN